MSMPTFFVGLDLGQCSDFTAIAVLERVETKGEYDQVALAHKKHVALRLRHLERMTLGTSYPRVVEQVASLTRSGDLRGTCELIVDATGVGRPVVDMLQAANLTCNVAPVTITGGDAERYSNGSYYVPKRDLVAGLQLGLQSRIVQIAAKLNFGPALVAEMANFRVKISRAGNEQFDTWREGQHDDLVLAVALACWGAKKQHPYDLTGRQRYWGETSRW